MNRIPNITLDEKQAKQILINGRITSGGEAVICKGENPYTLYKIFEHLGKPKAMGDNKEKKIIELYNKQLDYSVRPINTISLNDVIIGYEMVDEYDFNSCNLYQLSNEELLYFLKETKKILEYFTSKGLIYGDMEPRNILFNRYTGEIKFCDMDNVQIGDYKMDVFPHSLIGYKETRGIDNGIHPYMHNKLVLGALSLDLYCSSKSALRKVFKEEGRKIIDSMKKPANFNDEYILPYMKKYK